MFVPIEEIIPSPEEVVDYWKDVGKDIWDWLKDSFDGEDDTCYAIEVNVANATSEDWANPGSNSSN